MFNIPATHLQSVSHAMSKETVRYYLCGVYVQPGKLTATNGDVLIECKEDLKKLPDFQPFIMPADAVNKILKAVKTFKKENVTIEITKAGERYSAAVTGYNANEAQIFYFLPVDGTFPDCERIKPRAAQEKDGLQHIGFSCKSMDTVTASARDFVPGGGAIKIRMLDSVVTPVEVTCNLAGWQAVLMPTRI